MISKTGLKELKQGDKVVLRDVLNPLIKTTDELVDAANKDDGIIDGGKW